MDFSPRITSGDDGWHCNFHFGYDYDLIEDEANEKSCVQTLHYLIAKADTEIHDLEDELAILQCQLKWADSDEHRDPYEVSCATFRQKIDFLTKSIQNKRSGNLLNEQGMDAPSKIQAPAERISDIINTLIERNFSVLDEQVEILSNEMNLHVISGSVDTGMEKETTSESCAESQELTMDFDRQYKPAATISEESCSDTARYSIRDSIDTRNIGNTDVEVTGKGEDDYKLTCAGKNGFLTCVQHDETEDCIAGSKYSGSCSSPVSSKTEMTMNVEEENINTSMQHLTANSLCKTQDHISEDPIKGHQAVIEDQSPSFADNPIIYERKNSGLCTLLKPSGRKVRKKSFSAIRESNLCQMLKAKGENGKGQIPSNADSFTQSNSPSPQVQERFSSLPETGQSNPGDVAHENLPQLLVTRERELEGTSSENANIQYKNVEVSKKAGPCTRGNLAFKLQKELVVALEAPLTAEETASLFEPGPVNLHDVEIKSVIAKDVETKYSPAYDIESLRSNLCHDPSYLSRMRVPELKEILKYFKVRGVSKFKKEKMLEELTKLLRET